MDPETGALIRGHLPTLILKVWVLYIHQTGQVARKVGRMARNENESGQTIWQILADI